MFIVAITGGIATGKSTVSEVFIENGIPVVDADKIAREIVEPGKPCWYQIREVFGDAVFHPSKELNRDALGKIIFNNKDLRAKLNKITHPVIHRNIFFQVFKYFMCGHKYIVLDLPLLFETGILMDFIHKIITVSCESDLQLKRLMKRNEFSVDEARKRIAAQMPLETKCEKSHFVIDNNGNIDDTRKDALRIVNLMNESKQHWALRIKLVLVIAAIAVCTYYLNTIFHFIP